MIGQSYFVRREKQSVICFFCPCGVTLPTQHAQVSLVALRCGCFSCVLMLNHGRFPPPARTPLSHVPCSSRSTSVTLAPNSSRFSTTAHDRKPSVRWPNFRPPLRRSGPAVRRSKRCTGAASAPILPQWSTCCRARVGLRAALFPQRRVARHCLRNRGLCEAFARRIWGNYYFFDGGQSLRFSRVGRKLHLCR